MTTTFFWICDANGKTPAGGDMTNQKDDPENPIIHIGTRKAGGYYCFQCNETLCSKGEAGFALKKNTFADKCPKCEREVSALNPKIRKVDAFFWCQAPNKVYEICLNNPQRQIIIDDKDAKYTGEDFLKALGDCRVNQFLIGKEF